MKCGSPEYQFSSCLSAVSSLSLKEWASRVVWFAWISVYKVSMCELTFNKGSYFDCGDAINGLMEQYPMSTYISGVAKNILNHKKDIQYIGHSIHFPWAKRYMDTR